MATVLKRTIATMTKLFCFLLVGVGASDPCPQSLLLPYAHLLLQLHASPLFLSSPRDSRSGAGRPDLRGPGRASRGVGRLLLGPDV